MRLLLTLVFLMVSLVVQARVMKVKMTAYCLGPCKRCGTRGQTATGSRKVAGIAVDPNCVRLKRRVRILSGRGYSRRWRHADDNGGAIKCRKHHRMDYRTRTHREAKILGTQIVKVEVQ